MYNFSNKSIVSDDLFIGYVTARGTNFKGLCPRMGRSEVFIPE